MTLPDAVVLFGASGFIGRNIIESLRGRISPLIGVNRSGEPVSGCSQTIGIKALDQMPVLPRKTALIHVAAFRYAASQFAIQQAEILSVNTALTDAIYKFAMARGITEVRAASSSAVYPAEWGMQDDGKPLDLNLWPHEGEAAYAWSKRWGEITAEVWHRRAGINTISLRLTNPYGPFDTLDEQEAHVATAFVIRALGNDPVFALRGDPNVERDFVFAGDIAAAFISSLALEGRTEAVNCAAGRTTRIRDLADVAMRVAGREREVLNRPSPVGAGHGVQVRRTTAARLRELLPDLPEFRPLDEGMRSTVSWYRHALR